MSRRGHLWPRKGRPGWWAEINGKPRNFGPDKKAAERAYYRAKLEAAPRAAKDYTLPDLVEIYLEWVSSRVKPKTYKNYYEALQEWSRDNAKIPPAELRAFHLTGWLGSKSKWNQSTRKTQGSAVKIWSAWLDTEGYIDGDRLRSARLGEALKREAADPAELLRICETIENPAFLALWLVIYETGARISEITNLEASAIEWDTSTAIVDGKRSKKRRIGLSKRAFDLLKKAAAENPDGPVLRAPGGGPWIGTNPYDHLRRWKGRCDPPVADDISFHHCRHDLFRRWHAAGVSDVVISRQLGHTLRGLPSLSLLVTTYGHSDPTALAQAAQSAAAAGPGAATTPRLRRG